jgi:tRNA pseudouridine38-40 synthase
MTSPRGSVLLDVAYDGRSFAGFAPQPGQLTVAGSLRKAIMTVDPMAGPLRAASRTDSGVHARGQRVAFDVTRDIDCRGWLLGIQCRLPRTIGLRAATRMPLGYNPRFDTVLKRYRYVLLCDSVHDPLLVGRAWRIGNLHTAQRLERLRREWASFTGTHDFSAFASSADIRKNTERSMVALDVHQTGGQLALDVTGDGFLHHMVRIMVGTAVDVGRGRVPAGAVQRAFASGRREDAGVTAPPDGLCLEEVFLKTSTGPRWPPLGEGTGPQDS